MCEAKSHLPKSAISFLFSVFFGPQTLPLKCHKFACGQLNIVRVHIHIQAKYAAKSENLMMAHGRKCDNILSASYHLKRATFGVAPYRLRPIDFSDEKEYPSRL